MEQTRILNSQFFKCRSFVDTAVVVLKVPNEARTAPFSPEIVTALEVRKMDDVI